ncbi:uncharacterized protein LOC106752470 [Vigna radiata var. radiata]|uniref:Uncharacterized protein LOC106752470 n=1 Tax=Vigna radiata var. radiata TaxID=3916 RepID=A0A3Q0ENU8_VIGRR|nr:uncharacterized protein LOC106752470 [Vigna radiata var. radiata]
MDCLVGFASSVSRDLVCGALNQLRYLRSFNKFVKKLEQEEGDLILTRDGVQKSVEQVKRKTRETSELVNKWLEDAISDIGKVNQLLEEARTKKMCCFGYCPNWIWRYRIGKKIANKVFDLEKFIDEGKKYVSFDSIVTLPSGTLHILSEKCMNFESRQSVYEQLLDAVKNNDVSMIGLYGMGGCGKTTLAMEVMKLVEVEHLFDKVLFVPVSSTVDVRKIQEKIASSLQVEFPETEEMQRAQRLCLRLIQEKNIFIILDDVWEKLDFGRIGIPSSDHHKGCKILITTRSEEVCTSMDCQRKIYLPILTDEEAWTLFENKAFITKGSPDTWKDLGRLISNECKGLPVAIAAVACSLKGKAETVWRVAFNKLRHSKPINIERGLTDPYKCLQLSYDNLDTKEAKSLFLLCSVFPEDFEIQVELLTRCAIGLGVVGEVDSYEEARSEVIAAKIKLVSCCLLLDADDECVKMHDLVRDVAHIIAKTENKMIKCEVERHVTVEQNSVRYLWCSKFPNVLDCSNLEFLCLEANMKGFDGIFKRMGMLKVLILANDEDGKTQMSTISFKTLTNLRYLFIENYELSDFSFLGGMKNLQSLKLFDCLLPSFPELQTDVAITLKLLELNKCDIKVKNFEGMKRIPLLQELYIIDIEGEWYANSEDNIEFFNTFSIPETLQRYGIVLGSRYFYHHSDGDIYIHGRTLLLNHFDISNEVIKGLAKKAKDLFVGNIHGGAKNITPDIFQIEGGGLNELKKLEIIDSEELECLIDTSSHSSEVVTLFSKLHTLKMVRMENLKAIWHCFLPANGPFENLEKLDLSDCPRLTSLFTYVVALNLVKLKILKLSRCHELKHILTDDEKTEKSHNEFTGGHPVQIFQNLQDVKIDSCPELKYIFSANIVGGLGQLKVLKIERCDMLDQIIGDRKEELDEIVEEGTLSSLSSLTITCCGKLGSIFTSSIAKTLTSLEELFIDDCKSLKDIVSHERDNKNQEESIVEDEHDCQCDISIFQSLERLDIRNCDLLKKLRIFPVSFVGGMKKLNDITNKEAADLKDFSSRNNTQNEEILNHFLILQTLVIWRSGLECIFFLNGYGMIDQQVSLRLEKLDLYNLPQMTYIWVGPNNSLTLQHLITLEITDCGKLEVIFPNSVIRCLPELAWLTISKCMELKQIIEEDESNIDGGSEVEEIIECNKEPSNNYFDFPNLERLVIVECAKLEVVFSKSVLRCLPKLNVLVIKKCNELRQIIEGDKNLSNILSPQPCFPKLEALQVDHCQKLKRVFSGYASNDLPNLHLLAINGANELEELVGCKQEKIKVELPRLKLLIFMHMENFSQEIDLHNLKNCFVYKCPKLSLTSTTTFWKVLEHFPSQGKLVYEESNSEGGFPYQYALEEAIVQGSFQTLESLNRIFSICNTQEIEDLRNESVKSSSTGVEDIGIEDAVATHTDSGGEDILALDSKVVEQDDKMNESKPGIMASQGIQVEEGLNLLHKQEGIDVVPNNNIDISSASADIRTRLGAYKHFVDLDDEQISLLVEAITTYPHLWNASKKFSERFQAWRLKILEDMLSFLQESGDSIPEREKEFHKLCEEAIEIGFDSSWIEEMRQRVVARDLKPGEDIARRQIDENSKSLLHRCSSGDMVPDSQSVERGDGSKISLEEGSKLVDKESEISIVSNDRIVAPRNEELEMEFVAKVSTSEIPSIAATLTNSQPVERPTPSCLNMPLCETPANALVDKQRIIEPCLMNQQKPFGNISEITSSQTEVGTAKEIAHPKIIQGFGSNDVISLFASEKESEDSLVGKTLTELEKFLKMSLKDVVSSETDTLRSTLNLLSNIPFKDVTLSDGLKHIIETMRQHFPTILRSFKQGFATIDKLGKLEACQNEVATTLVSKISEADNFYNEAQMKEEVLKEQIKVCEAALSSFEREKNKCIAETIGYKKELDNVMKDRSQILEDKRKVEQELFEVAYKWSVLCSQYELNRMVATNIP